MSLSDSSTLIPDPAPAAQATPELPDEKFWQALHAQRERLLSGLSSVIVHALSWAVLIGVLRWVAPPFPPVDVEILVGNGIPGPRRRKPLGVGGWAPS